MSNVHIFTILLFVMRAFTMLVCTMVHATLVFAVCMMIDGGSGWTFRVELNCAEWQMVSKFLDKALFWLYLLISCSLQVLLFLQMWWQSPPTSGDSVDVSDIE